MSEARVISSLDLVFSDDLDGSRQASSSKPSTPAPHATAGRMGHAKTENGSAPTRMGARSSKVSAIAAMKAASPAPAPGSAPATPAHPHPSSSSLNGQLPTPGTDFEPGPEHNPARIAAALPRAPPLDFSTLRTFVPRLPNPPPRPANLGNRLFGIQNAPVYHPTIEQFADPTGYIESIAPEARRYGICKIVPPEGWRPPFALDTETFRFRTRVQELRSMEASARANINFSEQLFMYHKQYHNAEITIPNVGGRPMDLLKLRRVVAAQGGYAVVTNNRKWTQIAKSLSLGSHSSVTAILKSAYREIIQPFEDYVKRVKAAGGTPPPDPSLVTETPVKPAAKDLVKSDGADSLATPKSELGSPTLSATASTSTAPLHKVEVSDKVRTASDKLNDSVRMGRMTGGKPSKMQSAFDETPGEVCEICAMDHDPNSIVLCDDCDRGFHLSCLNPPLAEVPTETYFCDQCIVMNGYDYGFEEGEDHSLYSFRRRADAFKTKWLEAHPLPRDRQSKSPRAPAQTEAEQWAEQLEIEDHFEREFWRLVENPTENVEVEYGADVASTRDGCGMPNLEVHALDPYARDGWNLNNLPILNGSLLRYISSDVSGMTVPWIYVGMVFSTFAWHKEDHYTYSINYHHFGDTKTWYGIPGEQDDKLEHAMRQAAPELFEQNPDLMFQLVTLMSPGRLKKHGVNTYACDQRPNEFVITFPKAYHSGFNHGFNFNEAVNFALPDWLPLGLQCVRRYRDIKKNPVFSHDELLVTIGVHDKTPATSKWLVPNYREMVDRELERRTDFRAEHPHLTETVDASELDEEDYQCAHCKTLSFLSQLVSAETGTIACIPDAVRLPKGEAFTLRLRFSDEELRAQLSRVVRRSEKAPRTDESSLTWGALNGGRVVEEGARASGRKRKPSALAVEAGWADGEELGRAGKVPRRRSGEHAVAAEVEQAA